MNSADQALVKKLNKKLILSEIIHSSPISRASLSVKTGLNKSTVSSQVADLLKDQLIDEIGPGTSSGGRRPVMLVFNKKAGYSAGIEIGVDSLTVILTDLDGQIIRQAAHKLDSSRPDDLEQLLVSSIKDSAAQLPDSPYGLIGIGAAVPGLVTPEGTLTFTPNACWSEIPFKQLLEDEFHVPVYIENEANAGAFGEKEYGTAGPYSSMIFVSIAAGIGVGIIQDHKLLRGSRGFSGEMGHTVIDLSGPECSCGGSGCWELYASEKALKHSIGMNLTSEEIAEQADAKNPAVLKALVDFGRYVGIGLRNIIHTFDPEMVIIRSQVIDACPNVLSSIEEMVAASKKINQYDQVLALSELKQHAAALGCAAIAISHFIQEVTA